MKFVVIVGVFMVLILVASIRDTSVPLKFKSSVYRYAGYLDEAAPNKESPLGYVPPVPTAAAGGVLPATEAGDFGAGGVGKINVLSAEAWAAQLKSVQNGVMKDADGKLDEAQTKAENERIKVLSPLPNIMS